MKREVSQELMDLALNGNATIYAAIMLYQTSNMLYAEWLEQLAITLANDKQIMADTLTKHAGRHVHPGLTLRPENV